MLHDLPSDPLAAWFYKNDEGSVEISMLSATHMGNNTGETACTLQSCSAGVHQRVMPTSHLNTVRV